MDVIRGIVATPVLWGPPLRDCRWLLGHAGLLPT
jgi:hypothetical protein